MQNLIKRQWACFDLLDDLNLLDQVLKGTGPRGHGEWPHDTTIAHFITCISSFANESKFFIRILIRY